MNGIALWNPATESAGGFAVRMGLRYVKGLGETDWESIAGERCAASFVSVDDFVRRTKLDEGVLGTLAEAGGFDRFDIDRRTALWEVRRLARARDESLPISARERIPLFESLSAFEEVKWDYQHDCAQPAPPSACANASDALIGRGCPMPVQWRP